MLVPCSLHLILNILGITFSIDQAYTTSCQVYPSEYAYHADSFTRSESTSANCMRYPPGHDKGIYPESYIHCNGTRIRLTDSNIGPEQYSSTYYYQWPVGKDAQLLFRFPTRVSLANITLYYYSDSHRGLPRLRLYAVPDDFDVWSAPVSTYPRVDVAEVSPGREPEGRRNVSINVNFNTKKVLTYKYSSSYQFALSEAKFFRSENNITSTSATTDLPTLSIQTGSVDLTTKPTATAKDYVTTTAAFAESMSTTLTFITDAKMSTLTVQSKSGTGNQIIAFGVSIAILLVISTTIIITIAILVCSYKKRAAKQKLYTDSSYSTLSRGSVQHVQPQSIQHDSTQLYDQVHLSPSTGQTEFVPKNESANINNPSTTPQNSHPTHSTTGDDRAEHSLALNIMYQAIAPLIPLQKTCKSTSEQLTYAAVNKSKKKKFRKQIKKEESKHKAAEKGPPVSPYKHEVPSASIHEKKEKGEEQEICPSHAVEELYTAVKKKPKGSVPKDEEETPPIPPHTVEELYTAVEKKPKSIADENREEAPTHTVLQNTTEDLYTGVIKDGSTEVAPPLPPHTVEELYTAVMKKLKESTEDKEEAPPIPPYTVEEN